MNADNRPIPINRAALAEYESTGAKPAQPNGAEPNAPVPFFRNAWEIVAEKRESRWLLWKLIEAAVLAVIAGPRGSFKSFVGLDWLMRIATQGHTVVILSGEGAGIDRRIDAWMRTHAPEVDLKSLSILVRERALNLRMSEDMNDLSEAIAALPKTPVIVMVDTFSKFSAGIDENDNSEVAEYLAALSLHIREAYDCTVLLITHTGHGDVARPRGASSLMANPDAEYIVRRPDPEGMVVTVTRERFKDSPPLPPVAYEARVIDLGRLDAYGDPVNSLVLGSTDVPPVIIKGRGRNQDKMVIALKEWERSHPNEAHISSIDIDAIFKAQRINRKRRAEVLDSFVNAKILTHSVGGYILHPEYL